ncbi:Sulfate permease CysP [Planctomycetes bacterium Pan216]|uniref:Phosphate transporter n=1 Tax=Kolteria novifilia TaxID=2527975 RepID=A0A518BB90_9BACT|nr:Sulfate permease CysP [Planctomycetes bacterium Pan216]
MFEISVAEMGLMLLIVTGIGGFFMAFTIGANDVANSFASAVGAKAITIKQAVAIAGLMNILGAVILGGNVSMTLITGIINPGNFASPDQYVLAMISILLAAAVFVFCSTVLGLPVSTTHALIGSLTGLAIFVAGWDSVNWGMMISIAITWVASPLIAALFSYLLVWFIQKSIVGDGGAGSIVRIKRVVPYIIGLTMGILLYFFLNAGALRRFKEFEVWEIVVLLAIVCPYTVLISQGLVTFWCNRVSDNLEGVESVFQRLQVGTSSYVAFAQGANDVANAISPLFAVFLVVQLHGLPSEVGDYSVPIWILILGGAGIAAGIGILGHRVISTLGERLTPLTNTRGFSVDFSVATTVVAASMAGIPVSSSHAATGAVVGVGLYRGVKSVNFGILGGIFVAWIVTLPIAAVVAVGIFQLLNVIFALPEPVTPPM